MDTVEDILASLEADPANATLTKMQNGVITPMNSDERRDILAQWADEMHKSRIKKWPDVQAFMAAFTSAEKAAIGLSTDPVIASLRVELSSWSSTVIATDSRVVAGLDRLEQLSIIDSERRSEIESTAS